MLFDDTRLLIWVIMYTTVLLFTIIAGLIAYFVFYDKEDSKTQKRIKELREKSETDIIAKKRLKKLERKHKRKIKNNRIDKILIFSIIVIIIFLNLIYCVIPGWTDYVKKDYIVYDGDVSVDKSVYVIKFTRESTITLDDGTVLSGTLGLSKGRHKNIKLVYSKRTEIALWIEN